jgi:hypothetical protein
MTTTYKIKLTPEQVEVLLNNDWTDAEAEVILMSISSQLKELGA